MCIMNHVIHDIDANLNSGLLSFACIVSGVIKAFGEIITAKMALIVILKSSSVFQVYFLSYTTYMYALTNVINEVNDIIDDIFNSTSGKFVSYEYLMKLLILFIVLDLLISYVIQSICDNIANSKFKDIKSCFEIYISDFFYYKNDFIDFIIGNLSTIIRGRNQIIETCSLNLTLFVFFILHMKSFDVISIILSLIFIFSIVIGYILQYKLNQVNLIIDVRKSNALGDFIEKYKNLSDYNYTIIIYGIIIGIYVIIFWKIDFILNYINCDLAFKKKNQKLIIVICFILLIRVGVNLKDGRIPLYLKKLSEMILYNLSSVIIYRDLYVNNTNDYNKIIVDNLSINIDYDGEVVCLIKEMSHVFKRGSLYLLATDNMGKTAILKTLFTQFCENDNVYYANDSFKYSINNIKNIKNTALLLNNNYQLKNSVKHIYDYLMDINYYSLVKRTKLCKIMEAIYSNYIFVAIDNEMFVDFSDGEIIRILNYISNHVSDKILFICVDGIYYSDNSLFSKYECYEIKDGYFIKSV